jgi:NADH-quinone oxidoreductase subunit D
VSEGGILALVEEEETVIYMGPQHPSVHGFSLKLKLIGDYVMEVEPLLGYFHRSAEKVMESRTFDQCILVMERLSMLEPMLFQYPFVDAVEKMAGVKPPERAEYLRMLTMELSRIQSLLFWIGQHSSELGLFTLMMWPWRDREYILDIFEKITGARHTTSYIMPGGVRWDVNDEAIKQIKSALKYLRKRMKLYRRMFLDSPTFKLRTFGIGTLKPADALRYSVTGPNLKASGIGADLRKDAPYSMYDELEFEVPTETEGDAYARMKVRLREIELAMDLVEQTIPKIPKGELKAKFPRMLPVGDYYSRVEEARGVLGVYVRSADEKSTTPYRVKVRGPSFNHMHLVQHLARGVHLADFPAVLGSLDTYPGDMDR